jgi:chemotaxis regulatin CheY-phosphate phosphatase CheZ
MTLLKTALKRQKFVTLKITTQETTMTQMNTTQKVQTCLEFIDNRLETTSEQTIHIAEMIINDIKNLTVGYQEALQAGSMQSHSELVRDTQMNWVNQLHDIILEQTNRDLNGQVIRALQKFASKLNEQQVKYADFELPSIVARENADEHEYLSQAEIDILMGQQCLFNDNMRH